MVSNGVGTDAFGVTDLGMKRDVNEDQFLIADLSKSMLIRQTSLPKEDHHRMIGGIQGKLFVVADGLGGYRGGGVASSVALGTVINYVLNMMPWFYRLNESFEDDLEGELESALERCQKNVKRAAQNYPAHFRMGTTLTMAYVLWPRLYVVHAGDSRCYLYRGLGLEQITRDHTIAQELTDKNVISAKEAKMRWSKTLWNAVGGGSEELSPEVYKAELERGDILLLCTDGLTRHLDDETIADRLREDRPVARVVAEQLLDMANQAGGTDNITAIIARFE